MTPNSGAGVGGCLPFAGLVRNRNTSLANPRSDIALGIDCDPRVCGGDPCISHTRIPVWALVQSKRLGMSKADLLKSYPTLRAEDLVNAWAYEQSHRDEIDRQIAANEEA